MLKKVSMGLVLFALAIVPFAANAADLGNLTVTPTTVRPGGTINVSGTFGTNNANSNVRFTMDTGNTTVDIQPQGTVTTNASGNFSTTLTVPSDFATGTATLTATSANNDTLDRELTISTTTGQTPTGGVSAGEGGFVTSLILTVLSLAVGTFLVAFGIRASARSQNL